MQDMVLVIDDESAIREAIGDILETVGVQCLTAGDGESGVALYRERQEEIGLVILDLSMPGISGEVTLNLLQETNPAVRVILSSGYSKRDAEQKFSYSGVSGFLQKPYQLRQLIDVVQSNLA